MSRSETLPSFDAPPLNEVVVGVQFASLPDYDFRFVSQAYGAFRTEYPHVSEQPYLPPQYEVFGGGVSSLQNKIEFGPAPVQNRTWFASDSNDHLLQLQSDRFMLNWRATAVGVSSSYPRFEPILEKFLGSFSALEDLSSLALGSRLQLSQAEVAYINLIPLDDFDDATEWLTTLSAYPSDGLESISLATGKIVRDEAERPVARLHTQVQTVYWGAYGEKKGLHITLTVRGAVSSQGLSMLSEFLLNARATIVSEFALITSNSAHQFWKRTV